MSFLLFCAGGIALWVGLIRFETGAKPAEMWPAIVVTTIGGAMMIAAVAM